MSSTLQFTPIRMPLTRPRLKVSLMAVNPICRRLVVTCRPGPWPRSGATRPAIASASHPGRDRRTRGSPWPCLGLRPGPPGVTGRPPGETNIVVGATITPSADRQLWAAVGADDQLWVVRVYRRTGISVDRLAMHPLDEVAGRERPHARGVPGEVGVVEEVAPLAARAAAEERGGIDPVLRTAAGDG